MSYKYQKLDLADGQEGNVSGHVDSRYEAPTGKNSSHQPTQAVWYRRPSVFWLLPVFVAFNLAMGMTVMPRTNVIISLICRGILQDNEQKSMQHVSRHMGGSAGASMGDMPTNGTASSVVIGEHNAQCSTDKVESATAMLTLWGNLIAGILGAITAPLWGKVSDRYGRIKPLAAASTVFLAPEVIVVLIAKLPDAFSLNWIYLTYLLEGLSGTFILIMALASSYASDCSDNSERNVALGWFHGSMFFGFAAGPILGGYIGMSAGHSRPMLIFYIALVTTRRETSKTPSFSHCNQIIRLIGVIFLVSLVPESLPDGRSRAHPIQNSIKGRINRVLRQSWIQRARDANPLSIFSAKSGMDPKSRRNVIALAAVNTIMFGAFMGAMNVILLYSEYTFGWGNKESGTFLSTVNFFRTLAMMVVLPLAMRYLRRFFRTKVSGDDRLDLFLLRISVLSDVIGYIGYAISPNGTLFTLSGALAALGAIGIATSEASMTKRIDNTRTGELLGALGFLQAMARIVAPTVASLTYSWTVSKFPPLVFWGVAVGFVAAGVATFWIQPQDMVNEGVKFESVPLHAMDP
ncbi:MAG: hypothetical protein Q9212_001587 [Teloschistes hypoglaucus]